jgi:hypothetical protein
MGDANDAERKSARKRQGNKKAFMAHRRKADTRELSRGQKQAGLYSHSGGSEEANTDP